MLCAKKRSKCKCRSLVSCLVNAAATPSSEVASKIVPWYLEERVVTFYTYIGLNPEVVRHSLAARSLAANKTWGAPRQTNAAACFTKHYSVLTSGEARTAAAFVGLARRSRVDSSLIVWMGPRSVSHFESVAPSAGATSSDGDDVGTRCVPGCTYFALKTEGTKVWAALDAVKASPQESQTRESRGPMMMRNG